MDTSSLLEVIKLKFSSPDSKNSQPVTNLDYSSDFDLSPKNQHKLKGQFGKIAAVFLLLRENQGEVQVIFTRRSRNLSSHPGQISFPGGIVEPEDSSILNAGLREVKEEIGLDKKRIQTLGTLRPHETVSKFLIYPFVGIIDDASEFKMNTSEVTEIFEVPLGFLLNRKNMSEHRIQRNKKYAGYYAVPYGPYYIWGATARIIKSFVERFHG